MTTILTGESCTIPAGHDNATVTNNSTTQNGSYDITNGDIHINKQIAPSVTQSEPIHKNGVKVTNTGKAPLIVPDGVKENAMYIPSIRKSLNTAEPSHITIINNSTDENTSIALFQQKAPPPNAQIAAWETVYVQGTNNGNNQPGTSETPVPEEYSLVLQYPQGNSIVLSSPVTWVGYGADISIKTTTNPLQQTALDLSISPPSHPNDVLISVPPNIGMNVFAMLTKNKVLVLPPDPLFSGPATVTITIVPTFYVGVVSQLLQPGSLVNASEVSQTTAVQPGQTARLNGGAGTTYTFSIT